MCNWTTSVLYTFVQLYTQQLFNSWGTSHSDAVTYTHTHSWLHEATHTQTLTARTHTGRSWPLINISYSGVFSWQTVPFRCSVWPGCTNTSEFHKKLPKLSFITIPRGDLSNHHSNEGFPYLYPICPHCLYFCTLVCQSSSPLCFLSVPHKGTMQKMNLF